VTVFPPAYGGLLHYKGWSSQSICKEERCFVLNFVLLLVKHGNCCISAQVSDTFVFALRCHSSAFPTFLSKTSLLFFIDITVQNYNHGVVVWVQGRSA